MAASLAIFFFKVSGNRWQSLIYKFGIGSAVIVQVGG